MVIRWDNLARRQMQHIYYFYKKEAGEKIALRIRNEINKTISRLKAFPHLGSIETNLDNSSCTYRSILVNKNYKVVYYIEEKFIYIFAIWDVRQDPDRLIIK